MENLSTENWDEWLEVCEQSTTAYYAAQAAIEKYRGAHYLISTDACWLFPECCNKSCAAYTVIAELREKALLLEKEHSILLTKKNSYGYR